MHLIQVRVIGSFLTPKDEEGFKVLGLEIMRAVNDSGRIVLIGAATDEAIKNVVKRPAEIIHFDSDAQSSTYRLMPVAPDQFPSAAL